MSPRRYAVCHGPRYRSRSSSTVSRRVRLTGCSPPSASSSSVRRAAAASAAVGNPRSLTPLNPGRSGGRGEDRHGNARVRPDQRLLGDRPGAELRCGDHRLQRDTAIEGCAPHRRAEGEVEQQGQRMRSTTWGATGSPCGRRPGRWSAQDRSGGTRDRPTVGPAAARYAALRLEADIGESVTQQFSGVQKDPAKRLQYLGSTASPAKASSTARCGSRTPSEISSSSWICVLAASRPASPCRHRRIAVAELDAPGSPRSSGRRSSSTRDRVVRQERAHSDDRHDRPGP